MSAKTSKSPKKVTPVPAGYRTITPHLAVWNSDVAIAFYREAFQAEVTSEVRSPDGASMLYARLKIGNSQLTLCDQRPGIGLVASSGAASGVTLHLYLNELEANWKSAIAAGATVETPLFDAYWGDRLGVLVDPFGFRWSLASRVEKLTEDEIAERALAAYQPQTPETGVAIAQDGDPIQAPSLVEIGAKISKTAAAQPVAGSHFEDAVSASQVG